MKKTIGRNLGFRPVLVPRSDNYQNKHQSISNSACRSSVHSADPFDNMKFKENSKPALRPILNKHKKSPSGFYDDKQPRTLLRISSSVSNLPTIFRVHESRSQQKRRCKLPAIPVPLIKSETRNVTTPYFNAQENFKTSQFPSKIFRNKENLIPEVSFGNCEDSISLKVM